MAIFSVIFLSQSISEVPTGLVSDLIGRKKTIFAGALLSFIALTLYAIGFNIWVLIAGAICEGLGRSFFSGSDKAFLYETLEEQDQLDQFETIFGKVGFFEQIALGISALLGGVLALISLQFVMWIAVIPTVLSLVCAFWFVDTKQSVASQRSAFMMLKEAINGLFKNKRLRLISIAEILGFGFGEATFYFQAVFFNLLIPQWLIGVVRSIHHLFGAIGFWTAGRAIKQLGYKRMLIGGNIITSFIELIVLVFASVFSPFVMAILNVNYGFETTAKNGLMQRDFSNKQRATMGSIVSLAGSLCFAIISVLLGFIADIATPMHAMLFGLSSNIVIVWIYTAVFAKKHPETKVNS